MIKIEENKNLIISNVNVYKLTLLTIYFYKKQLVTGKQDYISSVKKALAFLTKGA
jgi:hypothetical protein